MVALTFVNDFIDMTDQQDLSFDGLLDFVTLTHTSTLITFDYGGGEIDEYTGIGFAFDVNDIPTGGTVTEFGERTQAAALRLPASQYQPYPSTTSL